MRQRRWQPNFAAAFAQVHQRTITPALRHIAVQAVGGKTFFVQFIRNDFGHGFSGCEDHALIDIGIAQDVVEQTVFMAHIVAVQQLLFDLPWSSTRSTSMISGFLVSLRASLPTAPSQVAENNKV